MVFLYWTLETLLAGATTGPQGAFLCTDVHLKSEAWFDKWKRDGFGGEGSLPPMLNESILP